MKLDPISKTAASAARYSVPLAAAILLAACVAPPPRTVAVRPGDVFTANFGDLGALAVSFD